MSKIQAYITKHTGLLLLLGMFMSLVVVGFWPRGEGTPVPQVGGIALPPPAHPNRIARSSITAATALPSFVGWDYGTVMAISTEADRVGLPPLLVLATAVQEGGLTPPFPTGDLNLDTNGSCGAFQIFVAVHGHDCAYWQNPVVSMQEMEPRWLYYFNNLGGWTGWSRDFYTFIQQWAPLAQGSVDWSLPLAHTNIWLGEVAYIGMLQKHIYLLDVLSMDSAAAIRITADGLDDIQQRAGVLRSTLDDLQIRIAIQTESLRKAVGDK